MSNGALANAAAPAVGAGISPGMGTIIAAFVAAIIGTVGAALITAWFQRRRNEQDRESQWRSHAVELTKLEVDRLIKTRGPRYRGRPSILVFLAHYRDLSELNKTSPKDLYRKIMRDRINEAPAEPIVAVSDASVCTVRCRGEGAEGHPVVFLKVTSEKPAKCDYCGQLFVLPA